MLIERKIVIIGDQKRSFKASSITRKNDKRLKKVI